MLGSYIVYISFMHSLWHIICRADLDMRQLVSYQPGCALLESGVDDTYYVSSRECQHPFKRISTKWWRGSPFTNYLIF